MQGPEAVHGVQFVAVVHGMQVMVVVLGAQVMVSSSKEAGLSALDQL